MPRNDPLRKDASAQTFTELLDLARRLESAWTKRQDRILDATRVLRMEGVKVPRDSGVVGASSSDAESMTRKD
eukprot:scaffold429580_cov34-Prasinocladus_malaysianus.AAC.1